MCSAGVPPIKAASGESAPLVVAQFSMRVMSIGPNQSTTASTRLLKEVQSPTFPSMSISVSPTLYTLTPLVVPASEDKWPPDENPVIPIKDVSSRYSSAWARIKRTAAFTSLICAGNFASPLERWLMETTANPPSSNGFPIAWKAICFILLANQALP